MVSTPAPAFDARPQRSWLRLDPALGILLGAVALHVYQWMLAPPFWLDEEAIAINVRDRGLTDLAGPLWLGQSAPYGWLVLQRAAALAFGSGERALRLIPLLFGIAVLVVALAIGRKWLNWFGAATLLFLCAFAEWSTYYVLESKQYSGDMFWALSLPALAAWTASSSADDRDFASRGTFWWIVAALGQWFSNGALLATPACALVLLGTAWRRAGWRGLLRAALPGVLWVAAVGGHYALAIRHTITNAYLTAFWSFALPPPNSGVTGDLTWLAAQLEPFAVKPGGTGHWMLFWISVAFGLGWLIRTRPALGISLGLLPVSACVLAALRIVPLYERLSLWILPALYAGIGGLADFASCQLRPRSEDVVKERTDSPLKRGAAVAAAVAVLVIAFDVAQLIPQQIADPRKSNHGLNDRAAVQWLVGQRQPGDDLMSSGHGLAAIWWYGGIPIPTPQDAGRLADGGIMFEVSRDESRRCASEPLRDALKGRRRLLLYLGWPADEDREAFDEWVVDTLGEIGSIVAIRRFETGRALVIELGRPMPHAGILRASQFGKRASEAPPPRRLRGCLLARRAARW